MCVQTFSESASDGEESGGNSCSDGDGSENERAVSRRLGCRARPVMVQVPARSVRASGCWQIGGIGIDRCEWLTALLRVYIRIPIPISIHLSVYLPTYM